ncbi:hypothetical protein GGQ98_000313 [Sphingosinicella soli]|uniref:Uncharacterized protein n=1 Tax=Sphingosinicella soli TaxID=333708 RepID=A0A7W7F4U3_9SPHN|nr:hypothetical protein [Sphingosinicella soli]
MHGRRQFNRDLHRLVVFERPELELRHRSASVGFEHQIPGDNHAHGKARPDRQRRRDVKLTAHDLLTGIVDSVLTTVADCLDQAVIIVGGKLGADAQQRGKPRRLGQFPPMIVDAVLKAGIALGIGTGLTLENDRASVREDQAVPCASSR